MEKENISSSSVKEKIPIDMEATKRKASKKKQKLTEKEKLVNKIQKLLSKIDGEERRVRNLLNQKEKMEMNELSNLSIDVDGKDYYPNILDPNFNIRLLKKKEFYEHRYDEEDKDLEAEAKRLCEQDFELSPHHAFIRYFDHLQSLPCFS